MPKVEKKLLSIYRGLNSESQCSLIDFAEFLLDRMEGKCAVDRFVEGVYTPEVPIKNESVIAATKRLRRSYSMLDTDSLFDEAASLMSAHILQGRSATDVIIDLEALFDKKYQSYLEAQSRAG